MTEECDDADVEALLGTDQRAMNFKRTAVRSQKMQQRLRTLIPKFESLGVFDCDAEWNYHNQWRQQTTRNG